MLSLSYVTYKLHLVAVHVHIMRLGHCPELPSHIYSTQQKIPESIIEFEAAALPIISTPTHSLAVCGHKPTIKLKPVI